MSISNQEIANKIESLNTLCAESQDEWEFCRRLVYSDVFDQELIGCSIASINNLGEIEYRAKFGQIEVTEFGENIWDRAIVANSIRAQKAQFLKLAKDADKPINVLSVPVFFSKSPLGVVLVASRDDFSNVNEEILFLFSSLVAFVMKLGFRQGASTQSGLKLIDAPEPLTSRQVRVLELMALNLTNADIARELMMSESTIRQESVRIYKALGVSDRNSAVKRGMEFGFLAQAAQAVN